MQLTKTALTVLEKRYLKKNDSGEPCEEPEDMFRRVAANIAQADKAYGASADEVKKTEEMFFELMTSLKFLPNSPTLMNAGRRLQQLSACFVLPVEDSMESIFDAVKNAALVHQSGGGTGFAFSRIRPKGDLVSSSKGVSSGPVAFIGAFDYATGVVNQGGFRRGANMGVLRIDHPDILEFIRAKKDGGLKNFNISVALTDSFMEAVGKKKDYPLINPRNVKEAGKLNAAEVFDTIVRLAWETGDPGVIFIDKMNRDNPTPNEGEYEATNPCGEVMLLPYESCNLGSANLAKMVKNGAIDWDELKKTVHAAVHFLDNIIDMNRYPLPQIEEITKKNRKIGLGVMGFADMLVMLGVKYDSTEAISIAKEVMKFVRDEGRKASARLAEKRGAFPNFEQSIFSGASKIPALRNATITCIAPTGTISMIAGCSSGIEPLFAISYVKKVMGGTELPETNPLFEKIAKDRGFHSEDLMLEIARTGTVSGCPQVPEDVKSLFRTAHEIKPEWHVSMQSAFQLYTDSAVSKTINMPRNATEDQVKEAYLMAFNFGCKGITVFRDGCKSEQVLYAGSGVKTEEFQAVKEAIIFPADLHPRPRPDTVSGETMRMLTGCGKLYITVNRDEHGPCEVFTQMGKSGGCAASQSEAVSRIVSLALRSGVDRSEIQEQLAGIRCPQPGPLQQHGAVLSCSDGIARGLKQAFELRAEVQEEDGKPRSGGIVGMCPDCGHVLEHLEGCAVCKGCGYSKCG